MSGGIKMQISDFLAKIASVLPSSLLVALLVAAALLRCNLHGLVYLALAFMQSLLPLGAFVRVSVCIYALIVCCGHIAVAISTHAASIETTDVEILEDIGFSGLISIFFIS